MVNYPPSSTPAEPTRVPHLHPRGGGRPSAARPEHLIAGSQPLIMSLDFYLEGEPSPVACTCDCGHKHERDERETLYHANITHNLGEMAAEAGLYEALWRPEEINVTKAREIIPLLKVGLKRLKEHPKKFKLFDSPNGWGKYKHFLPFVEKCLEACEQYPYGNIRCNC